MILEAGKKVIIRLYSVFYLLHIIGSLDDDGETSALYEIRLMCS